MALPGFASGWPATTTTSCSIEDLLRKDGGEGGHALGTKLPVYLTADSDDSLCPNDEELPWSSHVM